MSLGLLAGGLFAMGISGVVFHVSSLQVASTASTDRSAAQELNPLDVPSSAGVAATAAQMIGLSEQSAVANQADSQSIDTAVIARDASVTALQKPQVLAANTIKTAQDIVYYTTVAGDSLDGLAMKFGVTSDSIRGSNPTIQTITFPAGTKLAIPPVNGVVHVVKSGDTTASLAQRYGADEQKLIAFNDAELGGLKDGQSIVIPDGKAKTPVLAGGRYGGFSWGSSAIWGRNGYEPGNCTWYAYDRREDLGQPIPANLGHAVTWVKGAQLAGLATGTVPQEGAVYWVPPSLMSGYYARYGHVGIVEKVQPDGSVKVSSMNRRGLYSMSYDTLTADQASKYLYIY